MIITLPFYVIIVKFEIYTLEPQSHCRCSFNVSSHF